MSAFLIFTGWMFIILGGLSILVKAFKENVGWGLGCLFIPILQLVFIFMHWNETRYVFYLQLVGAGSVLLGLLLAPAPQDLLFSR